MNPFSLKIQNRTKFSEWRHGSSGVVPRIGLAVFLLVMVFNAPSFAQSNTGSNSAIVQEIERLRRDLSDVQRFIYRGEGTAAPPPATNAQPAGNQTNARLQRQILEMQGQIRELTGHIERLQHDYRTIGGRLDKLVADVDVRLQALEGGTPAATAVTSRQPAPPLASRPAETTVISSGGVTGGAAGLAPGQKSLGEISGNDLAAVKSRQSVPSGGVQSPGNIARQAAPSKPPPPAQAAPAPGGVTASVSSVARPLGGGDLPEGTARQQYEYAFGKLKERNYADAENALRAFVERHPDDPLAGNAMYWMGETYYVRKQYSEAAQIFLGAFQRFPKGNKAPDNLFKLAKSLVQIGETQSACTTYAELVKTFPQANRRIIGGAQSEMTRLGCS